MSLRELINKHQGPSIGIAVAAVALVLFLVFGRGSATGDGGLLEQSYFTVDDGKTYFAADSSNVAPFQHEGKEAVSAHVFKCGDTISVQYLSRHTPAGLAYRAEAAKTPASPPPPDPNAQLVEFKLPGEAAWRPQPPVPRCPDGSYPEIVTP